MSLPIDIYTQEILPYLPAGHLEILKSVCKDWQHLITSDDFVRLHLSRSNANRIRVLIAYPPSIVDYNENDENTPTKILPYPSSYTTKIVGTADGLICLVDKSKGGQCRVALLNPSTGSSFVSHESWMCVKLLLWWFGKLPCGEYVLVMVTLVPRSHLKFGVYKFTRTSLECIRFVVIAHLPHFVLDYNPLEQRGTLVERVVYWPVQQVDIDTHPTPYTIFAYHVDENTHSEILAPAQCDFRLGVVDGCLCATLKNDDNDMFELWILKESWTKYAKIHIRGFNALYPLGFSHNLGDIVLSADKSKLIKYNFDKSESTLLMEYDHPLRYDAIMCADTLVSPHSYLGLI